MSYQNNIFVFDDIISKDYQNQIKEKLFNNAGWRFVADVTNPKNTQQRPGFSHYFVSDEKEVSKLHSDLLPLIKASCEKINYKYSRVLQGRSFLQLPLNLKDKTIDTPHIDVAEFKHLVILYYVVDSDGETVIYENQYDSKGDIPRFGTLKEKQRVMPKQGRVVLFDGYYWHTSCQPENNVRCIINYNVI